MSTDASAAISDDEVVALARQILQQSREDIEQRAEQTPRELHQQQPGITIDLGHKNIVRLPEEVIDVIRSEIERLALSHNLLTTLPSRLVECKRLRYLNVRYNSMREFPDAIFGMPSLEILDVSRNRITSIPKKIANLTCLKVLAIAKNKIEELPICLGDITSLQVLKLDGNPLKFPPPEVCRINDNTPSPADENQRDAVIATQVKKYMRLQASKEKQRRDLEKLRIESSGDESWNESNPETPRPSRRTNNGRFPVRPSIGSIDGFSDSKPGSPGPGMPPPIPKRSHYRNQSSQNNGLPRRPNISPIVVSNGFNERNRSQSEGSGSATQRQKRMGIYTNKTSELGSVDEKRANHFRGFSQGYVLSGDTTSNTMSGPATAIGYGDSRAPRSLASRPLSDVREHKRGSSTPDKVVEAARNFLYAISQLHDTIGHMMRSIKGTTRSKDNLRRKEEFQRYFSATYMHLRSLHDCLRRYETLVEEDDEDAQKLSKEIYRHSLNCLELFMHVNLSIAENRAEIAQHADPRFVRSFLFLQQSSLLEMRNACTKLGAEFNEASAAARRSNRVDPMSTVRARPLKNRRYPASPPHRSGQYATPPTVLLHSNDTSRTNTLTSISAATPRSGESFSTSATTMSRSNTLTSTNDEQEEEMHFEKIYAMLKSACDTCITHMREISGLLRAGLETIRRDPDNDEMKSKVMMMLIDKADHVQDTALPLAARLSQVQLKDRDSKLSPIFWQQCMTFIKAWGELATACMREGRHFGLLSNDVKQLMKPLHREVKDASIAIQDSPFSHLTSSNAASNSSLPFFTSRIQPPRFVSRTLMASSAGHSGLGPINTTIPSVASAYSAPSGLGPGSTGYGTPVPATPLLNAALGAAAQATVPNTPSFPPSNGSSGPINFSERADKFLSQTSRRI